MQSRGKLRFALPCLCFSLPDGYDFARIRLFCRPDLPTVDSNYGAACSESERFGGFPLLLRIIGHIYSPTRENTAALPDRQSRFFDTFAAAGQAAGQSLGFKEISHENSELYHGTQSAHLCPCGHLGMPAARQARGAACPCVDVAARLYLLQCHRRDLCRQCDRLRCPDLEGDQGGLQDRADGFRRVCHPESAPQDRRHRGCQGDGCADQRRPPRAGGDHWHDVPDFSGGCGGRRCAGCAGGALPRGARL